MKRTQLYLDEEMAKILSTVSRQKGKTVSELVRECIQEKFGRKEIDRVEVARRLGGIWSKRRDLDETGKYVRRLRRDTRLRKLGIG